MKIKEELVNFSNKNITKEVCGFICLSEDFYFREVKNRASDPNLYFHMSTIDFLHIKNTENIVAIFHNHPNYTEDQSKFDISMSENICLPSVIYSNLTEKFSIFIPNTFDSDVKDIERLKEILND